VSFASIETLPIARSLAQIADREGDIAEVYLERLEEVAAPEEPSSAGVLVRREQGFAVRLVRDGRTWLTARDGFDGEQFAQALRQTARALPTASYSIPQLDIPPDESPVVADEVASFSRDVREAIRRRHIAFPLRLETRRHRREVQIVGTKLVPGFERELFYSCRASLDSGGHGTLLPQLDQAAAEVVAESLISISRGAKAPRPRPAVRSVVLGPAATAVFLHEAVAHALESDTLAQAGRAEAAVGVRLGSDELNVLDDPSGAPEGVRRATDDEGMPVVRRWLLLEGRVRQPLADLFAARLSAELTPGAGRRTGRYFPPVPRSTHLELVAGDSSFSELLARAEGGLYLPESSRGSLNPHSGEFRLSMPYCFEIGSGKLGELRGPVELRGRVADLLEAVVGVGKGPESAGAGWCAKGGQLLPVWAKTPAICLAEIEVGG